MFYRVQQSITTVKYRGPLGWAILQYEALGTYG